MLKKNEYNLMSTIFFYLNLSEILHFLFFRTKRERKYKKLKIVDKNKIIFHYIA